MEELTQEIVQELLHYNPETGVLSWKERDRELFESDKKWRNWNNKYYGKEVGSVYKDKRNIYRGFSLFNKTQRVHRVIWLYYYGYWPKIIDHINGDGLDNRICNIRDVSNQENLKNQRKRSNNTSGVLGVHWNKTKDKWQVLIKVDGKAKHVGFFADIESAAEARKQAEMEYGYHENHGRDHS